MVESRSQRWGGRFSKGAERGAGNGMADGESISGDGAFAGYEAGDGGFVKGRKSEFSSAWSMDGIVQTKTTLTEMRQGKAALPLGWKARLEMALLLVIAILTMDARMHWKRLL
jgi:hypothetical protein